MAAKWPAWLWSGSSITSIYPALGVLMTYLSTEWVKQSNEGAGATFRSHWSHQPTTTHKCPRENLSSPEHLLPRQRDCLNGKDYFSCCHCCLWWQIITLSLINFPKLFRIHIYMSYPHNFLGVMNCFKRWPRETSIIVYYFILFVINLPGSAVSLLGSQSWNGFCGHTLLVLPAFSICGFSASTSPEQHLTVLLSEEPQDLWTIYLLQSSQTFFFLLLRLFWSHGINLGCGS